jgi:two-component system, chemotaxis family, protein-glutamate methylesterase/glutaminase
MSAAGGPPVIGVGASAGGVEALQALVSRLGTDLPAAILVVLHQPAAVPTVLPMLLDRHCDLPVTHARDGEPIEPGHVYVAPPDHHLLVHESSLVVGRGPRENGHRPAIDPLFRSLALHRGPAAVGAVLSGMLDDGAAGLLTIVRHGGTAVVQDPDDSQFPGMPLAALGQVPGAATAPAAELAALLAEIVARPPVGTRRSASALAYEVAVSEGARGLDDADPPGPPAGLSCPDCSGPLFDLSEEHLLRYRCRVGHAWSEESLRAEQDDRVENALYAALQALEEKASLQRRIADVAARRGSDRVVTRSRSAAGEALSSAAVVRELLGDRRGGTR